MPRSLRVHQDFIGVVKLAIRRQGFPSQRALAEELALALSTVSNFLTGKPVDRAVFEDICSRLSLEWKDIAETVSETLSKALSGRHENQGSDLYRDWGDAPDVPVFFGREQELLTLERWILDDRCRLVAILGMGGMGKTGLSIKLGFGGMGKTDLSLRLADGIQEDFEYVIWRSLLNAPPIQETLAELVQFLSRQQEITLPESLEQQISRTLHYLQQHRCLILLDNVESILQGGVHAGSYLSGYEGYGYLFDQIGRSRHQSCLMLTSREKPREIALLEEDILQVRSLPLKGLNRSEGQELFKARDCYGASDQELQEISEHYDGNPLALKIVASAVKELANGDMTEVLPHLRQGGFQFDDINDVLRRQWERLSKPEQQMMCWLAINREPVSLSELQADVVSETVSQQLLAAVQSLGRRSLVERSGKRLSLQPVVTEYVTARLVAKMCEEIGDPQQRMLRDYALIKAQSKDYIRQAQTRLILRPVLEKLFTLLGNPKQAEQGLREMLIRLKQATPLQPGYVGGNILNLLRELKADLSHLDCSNLAIWQAYLVGADLQQINFANADLSKSVFTETLGILLSITFSPDGQFLATAGADGEILIWQTLDRKKLFACKGHTSWIWSVRFSPDGQTLASGSSDKTVKLWDAKTGKCFRTLSGHASWVVSVRFSSDGLTLVSASFDKTIKLWDIQTGQCLKTLQGHNDGIWCIAFSPDGQTLASSSDDKTIKFWNLATGQCSRTLLGHEGFVFSVEFSPDGQMLASTSEDKTVKLWNAQTGTCLKTIQGHTSTVVAVAFSPNGKFLASSSRDCTIRLWDASEGYCLKILQGHTSRIFSIAFSPDGQTLASGSDDKTLRLWNPYTGQCLRKFEGFSSGMRAIAFSPDGTLLATGGGDKLVRLWDALSYRCLRILPGHTSWELSLAFHPNGRILASASDDTTIKLWDLQTGTCFKTLLGHEQYVVSIAFSSDSRFLASAGGESVVKLWDANTGQFLKNLEGHTNRIWSVVFSPNGQTLASGGYDKTVKLWNVQTDKCLNTLQGHSSLVFIVAFSPDGQLLASGSDDKTIRLWSTQTGECLAVLQGHDNIVLSLAFSPDGQILVSGSDDNTIKLWDVQTRQCLNTLQGHKDAVFSIAFRPNGQTFASGSQDETVKIWDLSTHQCIATLKNPRPYEGMNIARVNGLTEAQKETLKALGAIELGRSD